MALQRQNVPMSYAGGVDTKTDPKQVVPGKFLQVVNGVFTAPLEIEKRPGYLDLGNTVQNAATITAGLALTPYANELVEFDASLLYSYDIANEQWIAKGLVASVTVTAEPVVRNSYQQSTQDGVVHPNGVAVFAWEDTQGGVRYSAIDQASQQVVANAQVLSTASRPKVVILGGYLVILIVDSVTHNLIAYPINSQDPSAAPVPVTVATDLNQSTPVYDATSINANSQLYVAYANSSGGSANNSVLFLDTTFVIHGPVAVTSTVASTSIGIFGDDVAGRVFVAYCDGTNTKYFAQFYTTLAPSIANTTLVASSVAYSITGITNASGNQTIYYTITGSPAQFDRIEKVTLTAGATPVASLFHRQASLAAKPFIYATKVYVPVAYSSPALQPTYFLLSPDGFVVAQMLADEGGNRPARWLLPEISLTAPGTYLLALLQRDLLTAGTADSNSTNVFVSQQQLFSQTGVTASTLDFVNPQKAYSRAQIARSLNIGGGLLTEYDGISPTEQNFLVYPDGVTYTPHTSGGHMADAVYGYQVVATWTDAQGQLQRSAPSILAQVTVTGGSGNGSVTVVIPTITFTRKTAVNAAGVALTYPRSPIVFEVYRTVGAGVQPFRVSNVTSGIPFSGGSGPLFNDVTADTVTFTDVLADATITAGQSIYTWGNVEENGAFPAITALAVYQNRLCGLMSESPLTLCYSKQVIPGQSVEFSPFNTWNIDPYGGDATALQAQDTNLLIFKETSIRVLNGVGPDDTGNNNDFVENLVTTDVGCSNQRSIVLTPVGTMFKSDKGIYLCDRSLSVTYRGADVEAFNGSNVVAATLLSNVNRVQFLLDDDNHTVLVYDYYQNQWGWFSNHNGVDACTFQGQYCYLQPNGNVRQQNAEFVEGGRPISLRTQTSWLKLAGINGFQRVWKFWILGTYLSPCTLRISIAYDYNPNPAQVLEVDCEDIFGTDTWGDSATWGSEEIWGGGNPIPLELRIDPSIQRCSAIQITIEDIQTQRPYGAGYSISGLMFEAGVQREGKQLPAAQIIGGKNG